MLTANNGITRTMAKLRELDSLIDFSRATMQLNIVLVLRDAEEGLTSEAIAAKLNQRRKAVLDALRKLEHKGLVERDEDGYYHLTELGLRFLNELENLMNRKATYKGEKLSHIKPSIKEFVLRLTLNNILYEIIMAVGSSRNHKISAKKLSKVLGLSVSRIDNYVEYLNTILKMPVIKKFKTKKWFLKMEYYKLTSYGKRIYRNLLSHPRHRKFLKRLTSKIIGSHYSPTILKRLTIINIVILIALLALHIIYPENYGLIHTAAIVTLIAVNALLYLR